MIRINKYWTRTLLPQISAFTTAGALALAPGNANAQAAFGPSNPFYVPSTLPFQAPPFDKIKDSDYQPAIEAGIAQNLEEIRAIADSPAEPTFENTIVAMEKSGRLIDRVTQVFNGITAANINPVLQKVQDEEAPKLSALRDGIYLNAKLFARVEKIYRQRGSLNLDAESLRLVEYDYQQFVLAGANLSDADKAELRKLNEEEANLTTAFISRLLAATRDAAYGTEDKSALAGLSDAELAAAADAANERKVKGWVLPLQNTTQQPDLQSLTNRVTRHAVFENSWNRAERNGRQQKGAERLQGITPAGEAAGRRQAQFDRENQHEHEAEPETRNGDADLAQAHHHGVAGAPSPLRGKNPRRKGDQGCERHREQRERKRHRQPLRDHRRDR